LITRDLSQRAVLSSITCAESSTGLIVSTQLSLERVQVEVHLFGEIFELGSAHVFTMVLAFVVGVALAFVIDTRLVNTLTGGEFRPILTTRTAFASHTVISATVIHIGAYLLACTPRFLVALGARSACETSFWCLDITALGKAVARIFLAIIPVDALFAI